MGVFRELYKEEIGLWRRLSVSQKCIVVYFQASLVLLGCLADHNPDWVVLLAVLNFGNSAWLLKRVPTDKLKED